MEKASSIARWNFVSREIALLSSKFEKKKKKKKTTKKEATRTHTHTHTRARFFFRSVKFIEPFLLLWWINHRVSFNDRKYIIFDRDS